ncbi:GNAT family N-acetyltransferase [Paenibacillus sp. N1-5-1-14]|uniref:GNAT family N-acetyltransferase n=1 Tax=Paenibacillus radicibacter TaxID=2972488 RepID=UPI00215904FB|nr:GNAT family N-acetyltransferase [Paenibacillus radicibacter]MCR8642594.1 GNAT family N-acetyltransferase [Paenibacillus radicibacter]
MGTVAIRSVHKKDIPQLKELMISYIVDFYKSPQPSAGKLDGLIETLLKHQAGIQFVAESEGKLVGFTTLYFTYSTLRASKVLVLNDLYVDEAYRGAGVAQRLFQTCKEYATHNGFASISWETASDNERAQRFYEKMGGKKGDWLVYSIDPWN